MVAPYTSAEFLAQKTVVELRAIAKSLRITGYSRMSKAELVETIDHARTDIIEYEVKPMTGEEYAERQSERREQDTRSGQEDQERPEEGQVRQEVEPPPASQVVQLDALELKGEG